MKRGISFVLIAALCMVMLAGIVPVSAADVIASGYCGGINLTWKLDNNGTLTISGPGAMTDYADANDVPWVYRRSDVCQVIIQPGVTRVGDRVFEKCDCLTDAELPDGILSIGRGSFYRCSSLMRMVLPSSVTSIGIDAFYCCENLQSIEISSQTTRIEWCAFYGCSSLIDVYYSGSREEWEKIEIDDENDCLQKAIIHFGEKSPEPSNEPNTTGDPIPTVKRDVTFYQVRTNVEACNGIYSNGHNYNWSGVSNAAQFVDAEGHFSFALCNDDSITVVRTDCGNILSTVELPLENPIFGTALCDADGNYYTVTGRANETKDLYADTVFISKYTADGKLVKTVGCNGQEGYPYSMQDSKWCTVLPFDAGNCDAAINNCILVVNYARKMNSGHQANAVAVINTRSMTKLQGIYFYNSHSFDQRVVAREGGGFLLASQGDCYPRAFSIAVASGYGASRVVEPFHFWVESGAYDRFDMYQINRTRAHLANVLETKEGIALVGSSVRSLSEEAYSEREDIFVQILRKGTSGTQPSHYLTEGVRSGFAGENGTTPVTDYGVSWLTDFTGTDQTLNTVQAVRVSGDRILVLYSLLNSDYDTEVWYLILNGDGSIAQKSTCLGTGELNLDEPPIFSSGAVQWVSETRNSDLNNYSVTINALCIDVGESTSHRWDWAQLTDVKDSSKYYYQPVRWAVESGIAESVTAETFAPEKGCSRGEIVTFLWRTVGSPKVNAPNPFADISIADSCYDAVLWAYVNGITTGKTTDSFAPDDPVTRAQAVTFLYRCENGGKIPVENVFHDVAEDAYYYHPVLWALDNQITNGTGPNTFSPNLPCTRGQIVTMLFRNAQK